MGNGRCHLISPQVRSGFSTHILIDGYDNSQPRVAAPARIVDTGTMALIRCDFFSESLALGTSMTVLLPQSSAGQVGVDGAPESGPPPVLYLLHGLTDDDTAWTRYTSIERYAAARGLAVVMPQVHRSFYADEANGGRFWTFLSEELPQVVERFFRVSTRREDTFVAGLSHGRVRRAQVGAASARALRRRGQPVRCARPGVHPAVRPAPAHPGADAPGSSATGSSRTARTTCCTWWPRPTRPPCRA